MELPVRIVSVSELKQSTFVISRTNFFSNVLLSVSRKNVIFAGQILKHYKS